MHSAAARRSPCAQRTEGVTLDHAAPLYDWLAPLMTLGLESRLHRHVIRRLALDRPLNTLDVGCGTGSLTRQVYDATPPGPGRRVLGVDAAEEMIEVARRKRQQPPCLLFEAALAEDLPFEPESFDRALSTFFFHHLNFELKKKALNEVWRVLKPGGICVIMDVDTPYNWFGALCAHSGYWLFGQDEIRENIRGLLRNALDESRAAGCWTIASRHAGYVTLFEVRKPRK